VLPTRRAGKEEVVAKDGLARLHHRQGRSRYAYSDGARLRKQVVTRRRSFIAKEVLKRGKARAQGAFFREAPRDRFEGGGSVEEAVG
jgi:hypothetical protein